jgi:sugar/nucleoside kinase (ribokinase family)
MKEYKEKGARKYDVAIGGYFCVDLIPRLKDNKSLTDIFKILRPGKLTEIDGMDAELGGVVANTGIALKRFTKNVFLNGLIGDDLIGKTAMEKLSYFNLPLEGIKTLKGGETAFSLVIAPNGVDRIFLESPGCNQLFDNSFVNFEAISQSKIFHFGYPPLLKQFYLQDGNQLLDMLSYIKEMGVITSMDFSLPDKDSESGNINWSALLDRVLPFTDIFTPSLEEALQILNPLKYTKVQSILGRKDILSLIPMATIRELGKRIIEAGAKITLIKAGHRGIYLRTGNISSLVDPLLLNLSEDHWNYREIWCQAYPAGQCEGKNADGAGDIAVAAFLSSLLDGEDPESSLRYAAVVGRNKICQNNILDKLFDWDNITNQIWAMNNKVIDLKEPQNNDWVDFNISEIKL